MMAHDQEIENHPFFKKHFEGKSTKQFHEMPHAGGSAGYHQWTAHHGIGLTPVKHKIFHRYYPETNHHAVAITSGTEGRNILGNHVYHSGEGEGGSATEAFDNAINAYKRDHGFHLQENINQFNLKDGVKTTYAGLLMMGGLNESDRKVYNDLEHWKNSVKKLGYKHKLVTKGITNHHYEAYKDGKVVGFFNNNQSDKSERKHGGVLTENHPQIRHG